jgi:NAD(P)-dependent dehydrogenase (short-subunit alcohol dehydrogenase family)
VIDARKVLVTGASRGIGRATMHRLRRDGYEPVGLARKPPPDLTEDERFVDCDLADTDAVTELAAQLAAAPPFYALVNNAAMAPTTSLDDTSLRDMDEANRVNVLAPLLLTQALAPGMRDAGGGRIVNISSRAALGKVNRTAYSATKSALVGMTRTWALELAPHNVTVNAIAPGPIDTEIFRVSSPPSDPRTIALKAAVPLQRVGTPEEVAHVIAFLLDDLAGFITGQTIDIDGGLTISAVK